MNPRTLLAPLVALLLLLAAAAPAHAQSVITHEHDPAKKCAWLADWQPSFLPGNTTVNTSGTVSTYSSGVGALIGVEQWSVIVLPGYEFGWVYAWDEGIPSMSCCNKAYARSSIYRVVKYVDCCLPQRTAKPTMGCGFRVTAHQLNDPGAASASGVTHLYAVNSGLSCAASAATTTRADDAGVPVSVEIPLPNGGKLKISTNMDYDSDSESTDSASNATVGPAKAAPDEEYVIVTDLDLEATADGTPWDTAESLASLTEHYVSLRTEVACSHCSQKGIDQILIDAQAWSVQEKVPHAD